MYTPPHFADINDKNVRGFIRQYSFGLVVSVKDQAPLATHLPFVLADAANGPIKLTSHFARANPQWADMEGQTVLVVFSEPHAYISPSHYDSALSVPTWNYIAVHLYGQVRLVDGEKATLAALDDMVSHFERDYAAHWATMPADYKSKMAKGIVAFEIVADHYTAINKLSQNKKSAERARTMDTLAPSDDVSAQAIARFMKEHEEKLDGR